MKRNPPPNPARESFDVALQGPWPVTLRFFWRRTDGVEKDERSWKLRRDHREGWVVDVAWHVPCSRTGRPGTFGRDAEVAFYSNDGLTRAKVAEMVFREVVQSFAHEVLENLTIDGKKAFRSPHRMSAKERERLMGVGTGRRDLVKKQSAAEVKPKTHTIVRAIPVEIAKPIGMGWDDLGDLLRDRRAVMHRLLNAGTALLWSRRYDGEHEGETVRALEAIKRELASYQEWCRAQAKRTKDPKEKERLDRRASMTLASNITDALQQRCVDALQRWQKEGGNARVPSSKKGAPIWIRDGGWKLETDGDGYTLSVRLVGATKECARPGMIKVAVRGSTGKHYRALRDIVSGKVKPGNCQLVYDEGARRLDGGKGKWFAIVSYSEERLIGPEPPTKGRTLIVHRGMRHFLYALCTDGRTRELKGGKFLVTRQRLSARMKDAKNIRAFERGQGAKGHGTARRYVTHDALDGKMKNVTKTFCQQAAAWVSKIARELGCAVVQIEDYGGQERSEERGERRFVDHFPYYQLKSSIAWACKRDRLVLREYGASFISQTCPACAHQDAANHNMRTGVFKCRVCEFTRGADWVATFNAGRSAKLDMAEIERNLKQQKRLKESLTATVRAVVEKEVVRIGKNGSRSQSGRQGSGIAADLRDPVQ